jgi:hypothetical protein
MQQRQALTIPLERIMYHDVEHANTGSKQDIEATILEPDELDRVGGGLTNASDPVVDTVLGAARFYLIMHPLCWK